MRLHVGTCVSRPVRGDCRLAPRITWLDTLSQTRGLHSQQEDARMPLAKTRRSVVVFQPLYALFRPTALGDAMALLLPNAPGKWYPHCR